MSCNKGNDAQPKTVTELVTRTWKAHKYDVVADSKGVKNLYTAGSKTNVQNLDGYILDLKADGSFAETEAGTDGKLATERGTWKVSGDGSTLEMVYPGNNKLTYSIKSASESETFLELSYPVVGGNTQAIQSFTRDYGVTPTSSYGFQLTLRP
jgi:hypothetical protein